MQETDKRSAGRANVFLTATLDTGGAAAAVRIRNISSRGALVEAASLPAVGTRIRLLRGQLCAVGELAWAGAGQGGINFADEVNVDSWVKRIGGGGQQRVDGIVAALRGSGEVPTELQHDEAAESLATISADLDELCERLANTPGISVELGEYLIRLAFLAETLRRLATRRPSN